MLLIDWVDPKRRDNVAILRETPHIVTYIIQLNEFYHADVTLIRYLMYWDSLSQAYKHDINSWE